MLRPLFVFIVLAPAIGLAQPQAQNPPKEIPPDASSSNTNAANPPVPQQVANAEAAIVKSDWKTAESELDPWLLDHPQDPRALFDAGYVADAQNRTDDALALYRRATAADPNSFEAHLSLGLLLARQGNPEEARHELLAATTLDPGPADPALKARAWRALAKMDTPAPGHPGDAANASNELLEALKLTPETPADTLLAARLAEAAGQFDAAESAYRHLLAEDPKSEPAATGLAHLLIARKQYPEAEKLLRDALVQSPNDPPLNAQLATVLAAQDKAEALPLLQKLYDAHPTDPNITRMLADVMAQAGDAAGSDRLYLTLLKANPDDPDLLVARGQNLIHRLLYPQALAVFDKATRLDPADGDAWSGLAFASMKTGQPTITLHALTMRSKYLPEVPSTYFLWATSYDTLHQKAAAITYYQHFLDSAAGKFPDQEWQAKQRIKLLGNKN